MFKIFIIVLLITPWIVHGSLRTTHGILRNCKQLLEFHTNLLVNICINFIFVKK